MGLKLRRDRIKLRRRDDEDGAELIEFALVFFLLIALVYGIVFFGLLLSAKVTMTQAAADGARAGIVQSTVSSQESSRRGPSCIRCFVDGQGNVWGNQQHRESSHLCRHRGSMRFEHKQPMSDGHRDLQQLLQQSP